MLKEIGKALRSRRHELHLSQTEIAGRMGCEYKTIMRIESGETQSGVLIDKYAEILGMDLNVKMKDEPK